MKVISLLFTDFSAVVRLHDVLMVFDRLGTQNSLQIHKIHSIVDVIPGSTALRHRWKDDKNEDVDYLIKHQFCFIFVIVNIFLHYTLYILVIVTWRRAVVIGLNICGPTHPFCSVIWTSLSVYVEVYTFILVVNKSLFANLTSLFRLWLYSYLFAFWSQST